jgi:predicted RNA-binding Zn-ribbon protein involved in translation (DUF1610 family)
MFRDNIEALKQEERDNDKKIEMYNQIKDLKHICPQCGSWEGVKFPRFGETYCEDCGWPTDDFNLSDEEFAKRKET